MGLSKAVVKNRVLILMIALILLVPAVFGMLGTRINYDMLDYLPSDMDIPVISWMRILQVRPSRRCMVFTARQRWMAIISNQ